MIPRAPSRRYSRPAATRRIRRLYTLARCLDAPAASSYAPKARRRCRRAFAFSSVRAFEYWRICAEHSSDVRSHGVRIGHHAFAACEYATSLTSRRIARAASIGTRALRSDRAITTERSRRWRRCRLVAIHHRARDGRHDLLRRSCMHPCDLPQAAAGFATLLPARPPRCLRTRIGTYVPAWSFNRIIYFVTSISQVGVGRPAAAVAERNRRDEFQRHFSAAPARREPGHNRDRTFVDRRPARLAVIPNT